MISASRPELRPAAVLALIDASRPELPLLLLRRSPALRAHPGQVALPGGGPAPEDGPLWRTALREAEEELGVPGDAVDLRGRARSVPTWVSGYVISPFVGLLRRPFQPRAAAAEVESYFWFPLFDSGQPPVAIRRMMELSRGSLEVPGYPHADHFVWGATGTIVEDLLRRMAAD
ncbi:MAG TPA: CoA pyrophosphatase [Candidatus Dormibacteraeota bacterium]